MGKTICLNMIVKDESHVIVETLHNIYGYIPFDYYVISDTGSSDATKTLIKTFFDQKGVSGEIHDDEWKDFGYNRSQAFKHAYNKTDYVFVWDADDQIKGDFKLPAVLEADSYSFSFGQYSRRQLFNNRKLWKYVGVLHEYPSCTESSGPEVHVQGSYHFESNRTGARNKDPLKYLKDGQVLEKAFYEALEAKDPIHERYAYYCANSYNSTTTHKDKAIEFYKKVLTLNNWHQEKYNSCIALYEIHESQQKVGEALHWLVESHKYDATRIEGIYRLVKHYCINGQPEVAMAYYSLVQNYYENHFLQDNIAKKLFVKRAEYEFFLPYYMIIVADRVKNRKVGGRCYEIIFERQHVAGDWWTRNLFTNLQFFLDHVPTDSPAFCRNFVAYVDRCGACLDSGHRVTIGKVLDRLRPALAAPVNNEVLQFNLQAQPINTDIQQKWQLVSPQLPLETTVEQKIQIDSKKVVVYMCVFHNKAYLDLLKLLLTSIQLFSKTELFDILVMTSPDFEADVQQISNLLNIPLKLHLSNFKTLHESSCARLYIYDYPGIDKYEKLLYIDTDIIVQNDLTSLLSETLEDKIYGLGELTIAHEYFGGWFFDFTTIDRNLPGMNAGILLFPNTSTIRTVMKECARHIEGDRATQKPMPTCLDQPYVNYHFIKAGRYDVSLMKKYALIYGRVPPPPPSEPTTVALCHFITPIGDASNKLKRMKAHMTHLLNFYTSIYPSVSAPTISIIGKSFYWLNTLITFLHNNVIDTVLKKGSYKWLDTYTLNAAWDQYSHIIRFNNMYNQAISICIEDCNINNHIQVEDKKDMTPQLYIFNTRADMIEALIPKQGIYAEIGIFQGTFTKYLYETLKPAKFYLLDLFEGTGYSGDQDGNNMISCKLEDTYAYFQTYASEVVPIKGDSSTQLATFEDNTFDMIYVDGDHSYQGCKKDLEVAYRKLKPGGLLLGHDYEMNMKKACQAYQFGVRRAVDEFCANNDQKIIAKGMDGCVSFAIRVQKS